MPATPLVTVVTPSYNQASFLRHAIESVLSQDYPRIEYIVMDGGSSDGSPAIIREYASRLAYWRSVQDAGQADAVNRGWRRSTGGILAFLNSDDYYLPGAIRAVVDAFRSAPEAGLVHGQGNWVREDGTLLQTTRVHGTARQMLDGLMSVPQPAAFIRRSVLDEVGYLDEALHFTLDKEFYLRVIGNVPFVVLDRPLACLRLQASSKSVATGGGFAPEVIALGEKLVRHPELYPRFVIDPQRILATANQSAAQFLYMAGRYRAALTHLRIAIRLRPQARWQIVSRELPRMALRGFFGASGYLRLSGAFRRMA
jgi:glycosyltransferase involved in cell wall biosynthesis